jgi:hypothetical protein
MCVRNINDPALSSLKMEVIRLLFITETESVYCEVRTGSLNKLNNVSRLRAILENKHKKLRKKFI